MRNTDAMPTDRRSLDPHQLVFPEPVLIRRPQEAVADPHAGVHVVRVHDESINRDRRTHLCGGHHDHAGAAECACGPLLHGDQAAVAINIPVGDRRLRTGCELAERESPIDRLPVHDLEH
jgi:hypothetical protein